MWLLLLIVVPSLSKRLNVRPACSVPVHMGTEKCDRSSSIRYHLDVDTLMCLPFKYTGCGGNSNNFASASECRFKCIPMDYHTCPANRPPVPKADGSSVCSVVKRCPPGSTCQKGFAVGLCCDNKDIEKYSANIKPDCGHKKIVKDRSSGFPVTMLGKSCDHKFCPSGAECHLGPLFAYCCQ